MRIGSSNGSRETSLLTADLYGVLTEISNRRQELEMSLFGLEADTSIRAMINPEWTVVGRSWFGYARMETPESHHVEFPGAQMLACGGRRASSEGSGCL